MHVHLCQELFERLSAMGIKERHTRLLLAHEHHLRFGLKLALGLAAVEADAHPPVESLELPGGRVGFRQRADPLPFSATDWQFYLKQRNRKAPQHLQCQLDTAKLDAAADGAFGGPLSPEVASIFLVDTEGARVRPEQAFELLAAAAPLATERTRPILVFEVLRYFWHEITNMNAAYVLVNARLESLGYPVIFNSSTGGRRLTFVTGIPQQHHQYMGYYACCA